MPDYPHVRASDVCPLCQRYKDRGLIACWPCYHARGLRYSNNEVEDLLKQIESRLCGEISHRSEACKPERL
jgi:hypothetical protein